MLPIVISVSSSSTFARTLTNYAKGVLHACLKHANIIMNGVVILYQLLFTTCCYLRYLMFLPGGIGASFGVVSFGAA
jgi:hypothetical protein